MLLDTNPPLFSHSLVVSDHWYQSPSHPSLQTLFVSSGFFLHFLTPSPSGGFRDMLATEWSHTCHPLIGGGSPQHYMLGKIKATMNGILKHFTTSVKRSNFRGRRWCGQKLSFHKHPTISLAWLQLPFRSTRLLKFHGEDVVGWLYRCEHFFKVDMLQTTRKSTS